MWGQHLIVDVQGGDKEKVRDHEVIEAFFADLLRGIRAKALGEIRLRQSGTGDLAGYTAVQLIERGAVVCHFLEKSGDFYLDILSCRKVVVGTVLDFVKAHFNTSTWMVTCLERDARG